MKSHLIQILNLVKLPLPPKVTSDNSDGDRIDPSKNDPPDLTGLKTYAKALKNARSKPKVQMTPMLNEYMKMKNNTNSYNGNLIELTFSK